MNAPAPAEDAAPAHEALPPGTLLGEFEVRAVIGTGGTSIVYRAFDHALHRDVALKEYLPQSLAARSGTLEVAVRSERARETFAAGLRSFVNEARLLAQFDHPSLIRVYRFWEANGTAYMVMPLLTGITLRTWLADLPGPPWEADLQALVRDVGGALQVLHAQNVFHRDVAPDNIMLEAGRWLLLDFGAARRVIGDRSQALTVILKPGYAPVEQYAEVPGMQQGPWTDVYALGAVLHRAITGRTPPPSVGRMISDAYRPLAASHAGRYSAALLEAIDAALAPLPEQRLQSVEQFMQRLRPGGGGPAAAAASSASPAGAAARGAGGETTDLFEQRAPAVVPPFVPPDSRDPPDPLRQPHAGRTDIGRTPHAAAGAPPMRPMPPMPSPPPQAASRAPVGGDGAGTGWAGGLLAPFGIVGGAFVWLFRTFLAPWSSPGRGDPARLIRGHLVGQGDPPPPRAPFAPPLPARRSTSDPDPDLDAGAPERTVIRPRAAAVPEAPLPDESRTIIVGPALTIASGADGAAASPGGGDYQLVVASVGDKPGLARVHRLAGGRTVVGRSAAAALRLADPQASAEHAVIEVGEDGCHVVDQGSRNGTWLTGRALAPLQREPLWLGAVLQIGDTLLTLSHRADATLPDLAGGDIDGRYRLERRLRDSPKGAVYAAMNLRTRSTVALKLLAPHVLGHAAYREQYDAIVGAAARLQHPHICPLLDSGHANVRLGGRIWPTAYLAYPLLAGGNLADRIAAAEPTPHEDVARWLEAVAAALAHAHRLGLAHGDLKPSAICFDRERHVYVTDFAPGPAARRGAALMGSPAYLAPEQWAGEPADARSDQFALAAIAYTLLTGARPFEGQSDPRVRERNFRLGAIPAHEEAAVKGRAPLSAAVSRVLQRALAVQPAQRHASVERFVEDLVQRLRAGPQAGAAQVFLSYRRSRGSTPFAHVLRRALDERHHITAFLDSVEEGPAGAFPDTLAEAIRDCQVFVCLLGSGTLASPWVQREVELAHAARKPMIPVFLDGHEAPPAPLAARADIDALLHAHGEAVHDASGVDFDNGLARVVQRVRLTLAAGRAEADGERGAPGSR